MKLKKLALAAAFTLIAGNTQAHDFLIGDIAIGHPFAHVTNPSARTAAAYLILSNQGSVADRLVSAHGAIAEKIVIHETSIEDGIVRMRPVADGLSVPAKGAVVLEPGQYHLMLSGLTTELVEGTRIPVTLTFEHAGQIEVQLAIEPRQSGEDAGHSH